MPAKDEESDEVDEEVVGALSEEPDDDTLRSHRAWLKACHFDEVVGALPDIGKELAPDDGSGSCVLFKLGVTEEAYDFAVGVGLSNPKQVFGNWNQRGNGRRQKRRRHGEREKRSLLSYHTELFEEDGGHPRSCHGGKVGNHRVMSG